MGSTALAVPEQTPDPYEQAEADAARQSATRAGGRSRKPPGDVVRPPLPTEFDDSAVVPIGTRAGHYYLVDRAGALREIRARDIIQQSTLLDLWGGDDAWLFKTFGYETARGGSSIPWDKVGAALMRACHRLGPWDPATYPPRYAGIWMDEAGRPLLHLGDVLQLGDGERVPAGIVRVIEHHAEHGDPILERQVYVREAARRRPAPRAAAEEMMRLRDAIADLWAFRDGAEAGASLALGWCAASLLGAAVRWRPNLLLVGEAGTGKSALIIAMRGLLPLHLYTNDTSKAGVESGMTGRPSPLLVDEAAQGDKGYASALFDMMLPASGGDGTAGLRGGPDGRGRQFSVLGAVCYGAIHPPPLKPEHQSRFTEIVLAKPARVRSDEVAALQARCRGLGPSFFGRVVEGWPRWGATLAAMRAELVRRGSSGREADQVGALLAGWWLLCADAPPSARQAQEVAAMAAPFVRGGAAAREDASGRRAWQALASMQVMEARGVTRVPLGDLVVEAFAASTDPAAMDIAMRAGENLRRYGIRAELLEAHGAIERVRDPWSDDEVRAMTGGTYPLRVAWFGRRHTELGRLFDRTDFAGEAWWRAMEALPGARRSMGNVRMGKAYSGGAFVIPVAVLFPFETCEACRDPDACKRAERCVIARQREDEARRKAALEEAGMPPAPPE